MSQFLEKVFLIGTFVSLVLATARVRQGPSELLPLRIVFLITLAACVILATLFVDWTADLELGNSYWSTPLGTAPLWSPPPLPSYDKLREGWREGRLREDTQPPPADTPGLILRREPDLHKMVGNLLVYMWFALLLSGIFYFVGRADKRDLLLHCGVGIWCGLTLAVALTYTVIPIVVRSQAGDPVRLACVGILCGLVFAVYSWKENANAEPQVDGNGTVRQA
jgi:hypothetical protein